MTEKARVKSGIAREGEAVVLEEARPFDWVSPIMSGVMGGGIAAFLSLVGMVEASSRRFVVRGVLSLGQTILLLALVYAAYRALHAMSKRAQGARASSVQILGSAALAGLVGSGMLALLVLLGNMINLRTVFIKASPDLYRLLTFGLPLATGIGALLLVGLVIGAAVGVLYLLPAHLRRAIFLGLAVVPLLSVLHSALFAGSGMNVPTAIVIFALVAAASFAWSRSQAQVKAQVSSMSPTGQRSLRIGAWILAGIVVVLLPQAGSYPAQVLVMVGIFALMGLGLNIVVGFAGLLDLGYVAFYALGAYTMGVLTSPEIAWTGFQLTFWEALPLAVGVSTLAGILLGIPVLGMRGDYLAIVTLGFGEIIRLVALSDWLKPYIGGSNGITRIPKPVAGPLGPLDTQAELFYPILIACLVAAFIAVRTKNSRVGRAWMAVREDEDVAQAMGIDLVRTKLLAFATGAAFAGLGGAFFATMLTSIYPHSFHLLVSINVLVLVIIGGMGSIPGVVVGALALVGIPEILREFSEYRLLMYGAALVLMMLNRPEGLMPEARRALELHKEEDEFPGDGGQEATAVAS
jgi:branched-chain amino acid transport system permease protein